MGKRGKKFTVSLAIFAIVVGIYFILATFSFFKANLELFNKIFVSLLIIAGGILLANIINISRKKTKNKKELEKSPNLLNKIITGTILIIAFLIVLNHFGVEITPLLAALGIGALAIGLALQPTLSNLFSGIYLLSDKPLQIGDYVELENDIKGYVEDIGWRSTKIKAISNKEIFIPNSKVAEGAITNTSKPDKAVSVLVQVGVDYSADLKKVEKNTIDVAKKIQKKVEGAVTNFKPFIRYHTFADSNINFAVILRAKTFVDKYVVTHEFIKALKERYDKEGIEISWPIIKVTKF